MISSPTWKTLQNQRYRSKIEQTWLHIPITLACTSPGVKPLRSPDSCFASPSSVIDRCHIHMNIYYIIYIRVHNLIIYIHTNINHVSVCHRLTSNWCTQGWLKNMICLSSWHLDLDEATGIWVATCNLNLLQSIYLRVSQQNGQIGIHICSWRDKNCLAACIL